MDPSNPLKRGYNDVTNTQPSTGERITDPPPTKKRSRFETAAGVPTSTNVDVGVLSVPFLTGTNSSISNNTSSLVSFPHGSSNTGHNAPIGNDITEAIAAAAARAAALARHLQQQPPSSSSFSSALSSSSSTANSIAYALPSNPSSIVSTTEPSVRRTAVLPPPLLLDVHGRPIDNYNGNILPSSTSSTGGSVTDSHRPFQPVTTLKVNDPSRNITNADNIIEIIKEKKGPTESKSSTEKFNPYLAHRYVPPPPSSSSSSSSSSSTVTAPSTLSEASHITASSTSMSATTEPSSNMYLAALQYDNRRRRRGEKGLQFVEAGTYAQAADEERERIARTQAYLALRQKGGRNRPVFHRDDTATTVTTPNENISTNESGTTTASINTQGTTADDVTMVVPSSSSSSLLPDTDPSLLRKLPPKDRSSVIPELEWWDAVFLPKTQAKLFTIKYSVAGQKALHTYENDPLSLPSLSSTLQLAVQAHFKYTDLSLTACKTAELIQHPIPVLANAEPEAPSVLPLMLTKKERKKLRRRRREEKSKFIQDQIRMGLLPPPENKVKLSNIMRVLKDSAVADPSAIEAKVRNQIAERQRLNIENQLAFKLTKQEKIEKLKRKLSVHPAAGPECAVFRIFDISDKKARFNIDITGQNCFLTGVVLVIKPPRGPQNFVPSTTNQTGDINYDSSSNMDISHPNEAQLSSNSSLYPPGAIVFVEGGTQGIRLFTKMLLRRINWNRIEQEQRDNEDSDDDDDDGSDDDTNHGMMMMNSGSSSSTILKDKGAGPGKKCELVWHGTISRNYFSNFQFEECRSLATARKLLETKGLTHIFDTVVANAKEAEKPYRGILASRSKQQGPDDDYASDGDIDDNEYGNSNGLGNLQSTEDLLASILQTTVDKNENTNYSSSRSTQHNMIAGFVRSTHGPLDNVNKDDMDDDDDDSSSDDEDYTVQMQ